MIEKRISDLVDGCEIIVEKEEHINMFRIQTGKYGATLEFTREEMEVLVRNMNIILKETKRD